MADLIIVLRNQAGATIAQWEVDLTGDYADLTRALTAGEKADLAAATSLSYSVTAQTNQSRISWVNLSTPPGAVTASDALETVIADDYTYGSSGGGNDKTATDADGGVQLVEAMDALGDYPTWACLDTNLLGCVEAYVLVTGITSKPTATAPLAVTLAELATAHVTRALTDALAVVVTDVGVGAGATPYTSRDTTAVEVAEVGTSSSALANRVVYVQGVDRTSYVHLESGITIERTLNERGRARLTFMHPYAPNRLESIEIRAADGVAILFSGLVYHRTTLGRHEQDVYSYTTCECVDYSIYLDWCYLSLTYPQLTLLTAVLEDIEDLLPPAYGLSVHGGPYMDFLAAFTWETIRASDALRELTDRTGRAWKVDNAKWLTMFTVPDGVAPENYSDQGGTLPVAFEWQDPDEVPANTVILRAGPDGAASHTETWTANGTASSWTMPIPAAGAGIAGVLTMTMSGSTVSATVDEEGSAGGWFHWDWATATISVHTLYPLTLPIPAGTTMSWTYTALFPFTVTRPATLPTTPIELLVREDAVTDYNAAVEIADGILAQMSGEPREVTLTTFTPGWAPGQACTVELLGRNFDATIYVKSVSLSYGTDLRWTYRVTGSEATVYDGSYLDKWRTLIHG